MKHPRILLLFVDGWGLAPGGDANLFSQAAMPCVKKHWGAFITENSYIDDNSLLTGLDATFGLPGLPQSATSQAALFTGLPVPAILGEHRPGLPGPEVKVLLFKPNLFTVAYENGLKPTFANTYTHRYLRLVDIEQLNPSCSTVMCRQVKGGLRFLAEYRAGTAITHDLTAESLHRFGYKIQTRNPFESGRILRRILPRHGFVMFEHFRLDTFGHSCNREHILHELSNYDEFLNGVLQDWNIKDLLIIVSDHGNVEDISHSSHTANPALLAALGLGVSVLAQCKTLSDFGALLMDVFKSR